jgi:hypothetical protein
MLSFKSQFKKDFFSYYTWQNDYHNVQGLKDVPLRYMNIGIKRMGEINYLPLRTTCLMKYGKDDAEVNADLRASVWSQELRKPSWHPFKIVETDGKLKVFIQLLQIQFLFTIKQCSLSNHNRSWSRVAGNNKR